MKELSTQHATILLVDDNVDVRTLAKEYFDDLGYSVDTAGSAEEALSLFDPRAHDLVLTDNSMPGMTGEKLAQIIKERSPSTLVVMFTGNPPADRSCVDAIVPKPASLLEVIEAMEALLDKREKLG